MALGVSTLGILLIAWGVLLALLMVWLWRRGKLPHVEEDPHVEAARIDRRAGFDRRRMNLGPPEGLPERREGFDRRRRPMVRPSF